MPRLVAFLRAINVGGHTVTMDALRRLFIGLRFADVETFIASGNVIFSTRAQATGALERRIEDHLGQSLGYEVKTFVRTVPEIAAVAAHAPFPPSRVHAAGAFSVGFLAGPLDAGAAAQVMAMRTDIDDFHVHGREVYWLCAKGQGESKFSNAVFEKALKVRVTFRGMNTVTRLAARYAGPEPAG
jgi:uncharacterized protein (DUF1697 family)